MERFEDGELPNDAIRAYVWASFTSSVLGLEHDWAVA